MARYVTHDCPNVITGKCGNEFRSMRMDYQNNGEDYLSCDNCGAEVIRKSTPVNKRSISYPYYNDSLDQVVNSREHSDHVASSMDMTPRDFGRLKRPKKFFPKKRR